MAKQTNAAESSGSKMKILTAAAKEFAQNGLGGARVDQIAEEAGVNKAMLYYHFKSKEGLYQEVIRQLLAERAAALSSNIKEEASLEPAVRQMLDFHAEMLHGKTEIIQILLRELANPESEIVEGIAGTIRESGLPFEFTKMISAGIRSGEYRPVDVRQAMISLVSMSLGHFLLSQVFKRVWQFADEPAFIEERKTAVIDLFMNGVKAR